MTTLIPSQRGLRHPANAAILVILYVVFCVSSALWALEIAQLFGLVELLLSPDGLSTDALFNHFYDLISRETKITGVLFELQVAFSDSFRTRTVGLTICAGTVDDRRRHTCYMACERDLVRQEGRDSTTIVLVGLDDR